MKYSIENLKPKKLIGVRLRMSQTAPRYGELWGSLRPRRKEIKHAVSSDLISMAVYDANYFSPFDPTNEFEKWGAVEVTGFEEVPEGMETFDLEGGLYVVFDHKGSSTDHRVYEYFFRTWLPDSGYELDQRPHFEVLGEKYKNNHPDSEEEIWFPIRKV